MRQYLYGMINSSGTLSTQDVLIRVGMSILFGIVIFISYRMTHEGSIYSDDFQKTESCMYIFIENLKLVID